MSDNWIKARKSGGQGGNCVELRLSSEATDIRDTKSRERGMLTVDRAEWAQFLGAVKSGRIS